MEHMVFVTPLSMTDAFPLLIFTLFDLPTSIFTPLLFPFDSILFIEYIYYVHFVVIYHMIIARQGPVWRHVLSLSHLVLVSFARGRAKKAWLGINGGRIITYSRKLWARLRLILGINK